MRSILFLVITLFVTTSMIAQVPRRAEKKLEEATEMIKTWRNQEALKVLDEAIEIHPDYPEAWFMKGDILFQQKKTEEAIRAYQNALDPSKSFYRSLLYKLGRAEYRIGLYADAKQHMELFKAQGEGISETAIANADLVIRNSSFALEKIANPVPFDPKNLGKQINTQSFEYLPALSADGNDLIFTRRTLKNGIEQEDFYFAERINDTLWTTATPLPGKVNTPGNEGAQCITAAGNAIFFTGCNREGGKGSCDIYVTVRRNGTWSDPVNLGEPINTGSWESQPSVSADGMSLFFASDRKGGYGKKDIWVSHYRGGGAWTDPENLGPEINTPGDEMSPFMHWDDQTLYFSSDGWPGLGGLDIFVVRKDSSGQWVNRENIGYPINHYGDQSSLIVTSNGKRALFTSDQLDGFGKTDLYAFNLPEESHAGEIAYMRGTIRDAKTQAPLESKIQVMDLVTGKVYRTIQSDREGGYFVVLPMDKNYGLNIGKPGYLFFSQNISFKDGLDESRQFIQDVDLNPIEANGVIQLKNVFFETNSYEIQAASFSELNRVVDLLKENPTMRIEVSGHTDNQGGEELNRTLSLNRAKSVRDYFISMGIEAQRMEVEGYGSSQALTTNETEKGRAENRRTEIKILSTNE